MGDAFEVRVVWPADDAQRMPPDATFSRNNWIAAHGKPEIFGSSPVQFGGDPKGYNPEELMALSLSQCHMLTYLAVTAKRGIAVLHYEDHATAQLGRNAEGRTQLMDVLLRPKVTVAKGTNLEEAQALHARAHAACFMASSVNFPVRHEPEILEK